LRAVSLNPVQLQEQAEMLKCHLASMFVTDVWQCLVYWEPVPLKHLIWADGKRCCRTCEDWEIQRAKLTTAVVSESCSLTTTLLILDFQHPQLHSSWILLTEYVRLGQSTRLMWQLQQSTNNTNVPQSNPKGKNCRPKIQLFLPVSYRA